MTIRGMPPGRAGRLWLERRIGVARRAADVLDRRLRILAAHQTQLEADAARADVDWRERHAEAEAWLLRVAVVAHRRGIRAAASDRPAAEIELGREVVAGVAYPVLVRFAVGEPAPSAAPVATAAADPAARACAAALEAAVRYALDGRGRAGGAGGGRADPGASAGRRGPLAASPRGTVAHPRCRARRAGAGGGHQPAARAGPVSRNTAGRSSVAPAQGRLADLRHRRRHGALDRQPQVVRDRGVIMTVPSWPGSRC